jgi:hypothetical protein
MRTATTVVHSFIHSSHTSYSHRLQQNEASKALIALLLVSTLHVSLGDERSVSGVPGFLRGSSTSHPREHEYERKTQEGDCPSEMANPGLCNGSLTPGSDEWLACAEACAPAGCCADTCAFTCLNQCTTYTACQNLGTGPTDPPDTPDDDSGKACCVLSVRYFEGFNLNYEITEEQASPLLPSRQFTPMKLKIVEDSSKHSSRRRKRNHGAYLISWYIAVIAVKFGGTEWLIARGDLFTHAFDGSGEPTLILLAALAEVPPALLQFPPDAAEAAAQSYKEALESISLDSRTGEPAHPIILGREFNFHDDGFEGYVGDEVFRLQTSCSGAGESTTSFSRAFIIANSQVFRSPVDRNVNFFNKGFIDAAVRDLPTECLSVEYPDSLAALLPTEASLVSVQTYGSKDDAITWHYEDKTHLEGRRTSPSQKGTNVFHSNGGNFAIFGANGLTL